MDHDGTREAVRAFYDQHPYPPAVDDLDGYRRLWEEEGRRRADFHLHWPGTAYREGLQVLVAGCGTSQAAKHALREPTSRVVGIDVSETSVRHTEALKRKYNLGNLEVYRLPVERVGESKPPIRQNRLHGRASPPAGSGGGAVRFAGDAATRRRDGPDGLCPLWPGGGLHAAGVLPTFGDRPYRPRDPGACRYAWRLYPLITRWPASWPNRPIFSIKTRWPTRCSTLRIALTVCRSSLI